MQELIKVIFNAIQDSNGSQKNAGTIISALKDDIDLTTAHCETMLNGTSIMSQTTPYLEAVKNYDHKHDLVKELAPIHGNERTTQQEFALNENDRKNTSNNLFENASDFHIMAENLDSKAVIQFEKSLGSDEFASKISDSAAHVTARRQESSYNSPNNCYRPLDVAILSYLCEQIEVSSLTQQATQGIKKLGDMGNILSSLLNESPTEILDTSKLLAEKSCSALGSTSNDVLSQHQDKANNCFHTLLDFGAKVSHVAYYPSTVSTSPDIKSPDCEYEAMPLIEYIEENAEHFSPSFLKRIKLAR